VLHGISLSAGAGQRVAIVGATGAGKSTLLALLLRLYEPASGSIRIDGTDIRRFTARSLRDQISLVPQDPVLFHGPVWENIAYGRPRRHARRDHPGRAPGQRARVHRAHAARLRHIVGERGETVLGEAATAPRDRARGHPAGRRSCCSMSRRRRSTPNPKRSYSTRCRGLWDRCTSITVAHRLATVQRAQVVAVLEGGVIRSPRTHRRSAGRPPPRTRACSACQCVADEAPEAVCRMTVARAWPRALAACALLTGLAAGASAQTVPDDRRARRVGPA
jgi:ABC-type sugar transport system ATPase subunit